MLIMEWNFFCILLIAIIWAVHKEISNHTGTGDFSFNVPDFHGSICIHFINDDDGSIAVAISIDISIFRKIWWYNRIRM